MRVAVVRQRDFFPPRTYWWPRRISATHRPFRVYRWFCFNVWVDGERG